MFKNSQGLQILYNYVLSIMRDGVLIIQLKNLQNSPSTVVKILCDIVLIIIIFVKQITQ